MFNWLRSVTKSNKYYCNSDNESYQSSELLWARYYLKNRLKIVHFPIEVLSGLYCKFILPSKSFNSLKKNNPVQNLNLFLHPKYVLH